FTTRLSLSSSNTDEVIQARLLQKTAPARTELDDLFRRKGDILKSQLGFTHDSATLKNYADANAFTANYPFAPFHFQLVQSIFESIRKAGATGLHLARGERSMLDAFQTAAVSLCARETGALAPLYGFFPCIENFLDTAVILSINSAKDNRDLQIPFDPRLLQTLFLIRYVEIIKPNVENLVTLCIDRVDADRIRLKKKIQASLERLEKQNLISRNGDLYFFLTNDEREVSREIKGVSIPPAAESRLLAEIIFDEILKGKTKHRYLPYKNDYPFNRVCDNRVWGRELKDELCLEIISPLHDDYPLFISAKCILHSANKEGCVLVKLAEDAALFPAIRAWLQTDKYIKAKSDAAAEPGRLRILRRRADENRARRDRLITQVDALLARAAYYVLGKELTIKGQTTAKALDEAFDHLVENVFSKYGHLTRQYDEPLAEVKQILKSDDVARRQLVLDFEKAEPPDIAEIRTFMDLMTAGNQPVLLSELIRRFTGRPYGWGAQQIVVLVARMYIAGSISLVRDGARLKPGDALAPLTKAPQWKKVKLVKRKISSARDIKSAQILGKELFGAIAPDGQDPLAQYIRDGLARWRRRLEKFKPLADTGDYPGKKEIDACLEIAADLLKIQDAYELVGVFNSRKEDFKDARDDLDDLKDFYNNQKSVWETLRGAQDRFKPNRRELEKDPDARKALRRMSLILTAPDPYNMLKEVRALVSGVDAVNEALIEKKRATAVEEIESAMARITDLLKDHGADPDFSRRTLAPFREIRGGVREEASIPRIITYKADDVPGLMEAALKSIDSAFRPDQDPDPPERRVKTIKPANLKQKAYLDTEKDVKEFIARVEKALMKAVKNDMRVNVE
ncbi:MAG: BREX system P-loop protein BrxC, partial [Desulfobacterales bacterium]|nr:BREX system P-loop protein BrxC [Desulfobacterales bacterium]